VYALNLLLIPVNLAGVLTSLRQALSGRKVPFGRTPKVRERTVVPSLYVLSPCALVAGLAVGLVGDLAHARWVHGVFLGFNGALLAYAIWRFIGLRDGLEDSRLRLRRS
jgi:hypothetical protein